ncbi:hypothetical protein AB0F91_16635 [Amycolatopsis sp. NPDC023774]|uniref:hypothetical protein n=1 Tax=Amycolatopsis sp. NPDC023774 TaxID=3155015 RepID=UPI0033DAD6EC
MNDLVARVRELRPLLTAEAAQGETDRRLTDKAVRALADAGLFRPVRRGASAATRRTCGRSWTSARKRARRTARRRGCSRS